MRIGKKCKLLLFLREIIMCMRETSKAIERQRIHKIYMDSKNKLMYNM